MNCSECDEDHPCQGLGEHAHFRSFGMAFLTLFRIATGDNWNGIMKDTLREECDPSEECLQNCCIATFVASLFFVVFVLVAQVVHNYKLTWSRLEQQSGKRIFSEHFNRYSV